MKFPNYDELMGPNRELKYTPDFKEFVKEHPGVIANLHSIEKKIEDLETKGELKAGDSFEEGELKISTIPVLKGKPVGKYLKAEIGEQAFFIKGVSGFRKNEGGLGTREFEATESVKEILQGIEGVEVVDYQLGYQDKNGTTYFVSKWLDFPRVKDYLYRKLKEDNYFEHKKVHEKANKIEDILADAGFIDTAPTNMLYDPEKETFYVYDIFPIGILD